MKQYLETKFANKKVLILGFAREGQSSFKILRQYFPNMLISVADKDEVDFDTGGNTEKFFGKNYLSHVNDFDIIIKSPGISGLKSEIIAAQKKSIEITSQTKIFFDVCLGKIIGVTGTKGKSTTSSLIYEMIKKANLNAVLVGNIGTPVLDSLVDNPSDRIYVFELSSHQLFDLEKSPHTAVVTNVAVDHLDWYGNYENYVDAKTHILKYQTDTDIAILNYDNLVTRGFDRFTKGEVFYTSKEIVTKGAYVQNGNIYLGEGNKVELLGNTADLKLIGRHNWDNIMLASLASKNMGVKNEDIWDAAINFKQLEHHLEFVRDFNGITFYDDSFAVDQIATSAAIKSFSQNITLILGGFDRGINYSEISDEIARKDNIKTILILGQVADKLFKSLRKSKYSGDLIKLGKTNMEKVVKTSVKHSSPGSVVLLSPAAASFDMFKDYKDRGEQFKKAVLELSND